MQALESLVGGNKSVVVCAPTGAGKTAIAEASAAATLARGQRVIYTTPLKVRAEGGGRSGLAIVAIETNLPAPCNAPSWTHFCILPPIRPRSATSDPHPGVCQPPRPPPAPNQALSNQKLSEVRKRFGHGRCGLQTGDTSLNTEADIVIMTTEILRNIMYRTAETTDESSMGKCGEVWMSVNRCGRDLAQHHVPHGRDHR